MQKTVVEVSTLAASVPKVQTTGTIMMVRPVDFTFNEQTAVDNEFQHELPKNAIEVNNAAMEEFESSVNLLRSEGVKVLVVEKPQGQDEQKTPDAVFPNNWISTEPDGTLVIYPMATPNRRAETQRLPDVQALLLKNGLNVNNHVLIGTMNEDEKFLEGTGSMVIDHVTKTVYGAISVRTNVEQLNNFAKTRNYSKVVSFRTKSSTGKEFYHTNVMMSIGAEFAVVCFDCIETEEERQAVRAELEQHGKRHIIPISLEQAEKFFCGNILEVKGKEGHPLVVMSKTALRGFTEQQRQELSKFGKLIALPIDTIEYVGGGSARCMMCEVFNPKK